MCDNRSVLAFEQKVHMQSDWLKSQITLQIASNVNSDTKRAGFMNNQTNTREVCLKDFRHYINLKYFSVSYKNYTPLRHRTVMK